jgi:hypothetical protein|tara:strand:+ start:1091 stop:1282 length:192 start_codon:yes stop_codon:yes gene_type:complete
MRKIETILSTGAAIWRDVEWDQFIVAPATFTRKQVEADHLGKCSFETEREDARDAASAHDWRV